jgi:alcohol dehydrogenase class IV
MFQILMSDRTIVGADAISSAGEQIRALGSQALLISGQIVEKNGIVKKLTNVLDEVNVKYTVFTDITGEPDDIMIAEAKKAFDQSGCDMVIGIGGGSPQDSAKAVSAISDHAPIVLIPTTAGSGSEATKFYCVTESATDTKKLITDEKVIPRLAIIDPTLSVTAPKSITAATGMDALTHAVEAFTSRKATPYTDMFALSAIRRVFEYLPRAYEDGEDIEARTEMAFAAYEAGVCINNASVTLVHGMSRPIGALFHVPHGISNAMLIVKCLMFAKEGCPHKFAEIGRTLGAAGTDAECAELFFVYLQDLCRTIKIPTLAEYGIDQEDFFSKIDKMAKDAIASGSPGNTIRDINTTDIIKLYASLWN